MTPEYPVVAQTALLVPAINSPNFNLQTPASSPSPSWAILQNGLAYFFGLVLSGGTITGPDYIINTSGIFIYNGAPALGNLIGSWAGVAGTDAFGNVFPQGFSITQGSISGSVFTGTNFVINSAGLFFYSGTPAAGNLVLSVSQNSGTDAFGNAYGQGFRLYGPNSAAMNMLLSGASPLLALQPGSLTHLTTAGALSNQSINAGAANEQQLVVLTSGKEGHDDGALQLFSASADNTVGASAVIEFGGGVFATFTKTGVVLSGGSTPAAVAGSASVFGTTNGSLQVVDGSDSQVYGTERRTLILVNNTALAASPGTTLFQTQVAVRSYRVHGMILVAVTTANQQLSINIAPPSGTGFAGAHIGRAGTVISYTNFNLNALTGIGGAGALLIGSSYLCWFDAIINVTGAGALNFIFAGTNAGDLTVQANSYAEILPI
jgi:hypothetical protein